MRLTFRLLASAIVAGLAGGSAFAQSAKAEEKVKIAQEQLERLAQQRRAEEVQQAELKKAQEQLEKLLLQLKEQENKPRADTPKVPPPPSPVRPAADSTKKPSLLVVPAGSGEDAAKLQKLLADLAEQESKRGRPDAQKQPTPPAPPAPPIPAKPMVWSVQGQSGDAMAAIKGLISISKDPKTVELAKQLLEQLAKSSPKLEAGSHFQWKEIPLGQKSFELKLEALKGLQDLEFKLAPQSKPSSTQPETTVERRVVTATLAGKPSGGAATLKMSADGKLAAHVGADGTITIFDVATGKEMMKFAGK